MPKKIKKRRLAGAVKKKTTIMRKVKKKLPIVFENTFNKKDIKLVFSGEKVGKRPVYYDSFGARVSANTEKIRKIVGIGKWKSKDKKLQEYQKIYQKQFNPRFLDELKKTKDKYIDIGNLGSETTTVKRDSSGHYLYQMYDFYPMMAVHKGDRYMKPQKFIPGIGLKGLGVGKAVMQAFEDKLKKDNIIRTKEENIKYFDDRFSKQAKEKKAKLMGITMEELRESFAKPKIEKSHIKGINVTTPFAEHSENFYRSIGFIGKTKNFKLKDQKQNLVDYIKDRKQVCKALVKLLKKGGKKLEIPNFDLFNKFAKKAENAKTRDELVAIYEKFYGSSSRRLEHKLRTLSKEAGYTYLPILSHLKE